MKLVQPVPEYCVGIDVSIPVPQVRTVEFLEIPGIHKKSIQVPVPVIHQMLFKLGTQFVCFLNKMK
jgi:hypothetical protein